MTKDSVLTLSTLFTPHNALKTTTLAERLKQGAISIAQRSAAIDKLSKVTIRNLNGSSVAQAGEQGHDGARG